MSAITAKASRKMKKYAVLTREPRCFLGSFDFSWEQRKLGDIASDMVAGGDIDKDLILAEGQYPVIANALTGDGIVGYYDKEYRVNAPAVTVTGRGDVGHAKARLVNFTPVVRLLSVKSEHDVFFLENAINTLKIVIESTGVPQLTVPQLAKYEVAFPRQLDEEEHIGAFFKQLDHLITLHQRKCALLFSPFQAFISMMFITSTFSWEQRKLASLCEKFTDGDWIESKDQSDFGVRLVQTGNVGVAEYLDKPNNKKWISEDTFDRLHCEEVLPGDILISRLPEPAGRACIVPLLGTKMITAVDCTIVRTAPDMSNKFLVQYLSSQAYFDDVNTCLAGGTRQRISRGNLANFNVPIPVKKSEQDAIGMFFGYLDNLITLHQRKCIFFTGRAGRLISTVNKKRITSSWEQRKFEEIAVRSSVICSDDTLPRVEYEDIVSGTGRLNKDIYAKQSSKSGIVFHQGDVLYGKLRPYLQNWLLPTFDGLAVGDFWVLQPQNADSSFLYRLIQSRQFDEVANQSTGTKMPRADWKLVSKTVFSIPSNISEQAAIGTYFTALDSLITLHQRKPFLMKWRTSDANRNQTNRLVL